jgi:hypothetical protein
VSLSATVARDVTWITLIFVVVKTPTCALGEKLRFIVVEIHWGINGPTFETTEHHDQHEVRRADRVRDSLRFRVSPGVGR